MNNITTGHVRAFQVVRSPLYDNVTLVNCRINNEPGVAIVMAEEPVTGVISIMPLFVAITPGMKLEFPGEAASGGGSGGPKNPRAAFDVNKRFVCATPA